MSDWRLVTMVVLSAEDDEEPICQFFEPGHLNQVVGIGEMIRDELSDMAWGDEVRYAVKVEKMQVTYGAFIFPFPLVAHTDDLVSDGYILMKREYCAVFDSHLEFTQWGMAGDDDCKKVRQENMTKTMNEAGIGGHLLREVPGTNVKNLDSDNPAVWLYDENNNRVILAEKYYRPLSRIGFKFYRQPGDETQPVTIMKGDDVAGVVMPMVSNE